MTLPTVDLDGDLLVVEGTENNDVIEVSYVNDNGRWKIQTVTDGVGNVTNYTYDSAGNLHRVQYK